MNTTQSWLWQARHLTATALAHPSAIDYVRTELALGGATSALKALHAAAGTAYEDRLGLAGNAAPHLEAGRLPADIEDIGDFDAAIMRLDRASFAMGTGGVTPEMRAQAIRDGLFVVQVAREALAPDPALRTALRAHWVARVFLDTVQDLPEDAEVDRHVLVVVAAGHAVDSVRAARHFAPRGDARLQDAWPEPSPVIRERLERLDANKGASEIGSLTRRGLDILQNDAESLVMQAALILTQAEAAQPQPEPEDSPQPG